MSFFTWFINLFRSNLTLMEIAVKEVVIVSLKSNSALKTPLLGAISQMQSLISAGLTISSVSSLPDLLKSKVDLTKLPAEQQVVLGPVLSEAIDSIVDQIGSYIDKANILSASNKTEVVSKVLGWVSDAAQLV